MTSRWLIALILGTLCGCELHAAYAAFDDLQVQTPAWLQLPASAGLPVVYRISRCSVDEALVELRTTGAPVDLHWCLPGYQRDALLFITQVLTGAVTQVRVPLAQIDHGLFRLRLTLSSDGTMPVGATTAAATAAYGVNVAGITAHFRSESLGYIVSLRDGVADVHVRNFSAEPIHCDFTLAGFQDPRREANPRLHLLPGSTTEVLIPLAQPDPRVADAVLDVWNIVVGADDRGAALVNQPQFSDHLLPQENWYPVGILNDTEGSVRFNPRVVCWQASDDRLRVRNRSPSAIMAEVHLRLGDQIVQVPMHLPPDSTVEVPTPINVPPGQRLFVALTHLAVDGQAVQRALPAITAAPVPGQALAITPRQPDVRFNPLMLAYVLERAGDGRARLTVINRSAIAVHADCAIVGYQPEEPSNPRLHLPPGQSATVELLVTRSDVRLALARVLVWNVRLGEDSGDLLVAVR
ncbi:MAG TPA: hypothetical protein VHX44_11465 [Planctomycetota bacterium]|nr:hypothetical protein [Planctomycetota bacterium]